MNNETKKKMNNEIEGNMNNETKKKINSEIEENMNNEGRNIEELEEIWNQKEGMWK